jgi:protein TonB
MSKDFVMNPWTTQGFPVDGARVRLPIRLTLDATPPKLAEPAAQVGTIADPDWIRMPNSHDMARYFPDLAMRKNQGGRAKMMCGVTADGYLHGCAILDEDPVGLGFGPASLELAHLFQMKPKPPLRTFPPGGTIVLPIHWVLPGGW